MLLHDMSPMGEAVYICLVAFSVVFIVLILLTLVIYAMRGLGGKEKTAASPARPASKPAATPTSKGTVKAEVATVAEVSVAGVSPQMVAAITAAITASMGSRPFKIGSIRPGRESQSRRVPSTWGEVSRLENMCGALREPWEF